MSDTSSLVSSEFLDSYAQLILRWNRQINLISRKNSARLLESLFHQCVCGVEVLVQHLAQTPDENPSGQTKNPFTQGVEYFDLGSGGGIPGIIWSEYFRNMDCLLDSFLVEPRDKRAWFLELAGKLSTEQTPVVVQGRWGEIGSLERTGSRCPRVVISLKALHLTDEEVLRGYFSTIPTANPFQIVIARYYPGDQQIDDSLQQKLAFPFRESPQLFLGLGFDGVEVLNWDHGSLVPASLVVNRYSVP